MIGFSQGAAFAALICTIVGVSFDPELIMLTAHYGWADGKAGIISVYYDRRAPSPASIVRSIQSIISRLMLCHSKFGIFVAGFKPLVPAMASLMSEGTFTPSLHVHGQTDFIVGEWRRQSLVRAFVDPRIVEHEGGGSSPSSDGSECC